MSVAELAKWQAAADEALRRGDRAEAAACAQQILAISPGDARALNQVGNWFLAQGHAEQARAHLKRAADSDPGQPALLFNLAMAARAAGKPAEAIAALRDALVVDPDFIQAMFQLAILYEENGDWRSAAHVYRNFVDTAPPEILNAPQFAEPLARARAAIAADNAALSTAVFSGPAMVSIRAREAADALLGKTRIYVAEPTFLSVPRLPAIPFLDRSLFPWLETLESQAPAIAAEARALLSAGGEDAFVPYVANPKGTALNQWAPLDHKRSWGAFFLWKHGVRTAENCRRCPQTARALDTVPLITLDGRAPNAFFSWLDPHTRIPAHTGVTNARLTVHLPLIVPPDCGFRVGAETRTWEEGKAWVFDDTIEHEAWNDSDAPRLILIFDIWHPALDEGEQAFFTHLLRAYDAHYGRRTGLTDTL